MPLIPPIQPKPSGEFCYGGGGWTARDDPQAFVLTDRYPGFLNRYSLTGVEEDKAEVFAHLMGNFATVERRSRTDPVLRARVARMKELLATFCPAVDSAFWEKVGRCSVAGGRHRLTDKGNRTAGVGIYSRLRR
jgi:hypothetical protein